MTHIFSTVQLLSHYGNINALSLFENLIQKMLENHSPHRSFEGAALRLGDGIRLRRGAAHPGSAAIDAADFCVLHKIFTIKHTHI